MSIVIRNMAPNDNAPLSFLIKRIFEEFGIDRPGTVYTDPTTDSLYEVFQHPEAAYFIAEENGVILGGCGVYPTDGLPEGYGELVKFYLSPASRGKGLGHTLMQKTFEAAAALGYSHLYLESFPELGNAVSLYERNGFVTIDEQLGNSGHYATTIWMVKEL